MPEVIHYPFLTDLRIQTGRRLEHQHVSLSGNSLACLTLTCTTAARSAGTATFLQQAISRPALNANNANSNSAGERMQEEVDLHRRRTHLIAFLVDCARLKRMAVE